MTNRPLSVKAIRNNACIIALLWTGLCAGLMVYFFSLPYYIAIVDSVLNNVLLCASCVALSNMLGYYQPKNDKILYVLIVTGVLTAVVVYAASFAIAQVYPQQKAYMLFYSQSLGLRALLIFLCLSWCALVNILWYRLEEQSETQERLLHAQNLAKEAELNKLRHHLQPHFLFNSLNSVFALTMINPPEAGNMITKLATFLRGTLKRDDEVWVSVAEEMDYIGLYLEIEKTRFSHRLDIDMKVDEEALEARLPGTFVQPLVENAIKFGLYNTSKAVCIKIRVFLAHQVLHISVENPFDPEIQSAKGTGFGLSAIRRRLFLLFGNADLLQTEVKDHHIYCTYLQIPQRND